MLAALIGLGPSLVHAQAPAEGAGAPSADAFDIRYFLVDADGNRDRAMAEIDFNQFFNQARCQCGQPVDAQVRLTTGMGAMYNPSMLVETFVGTMCAIAESNPLAGQFRPCARIASQTVQNYTRGINIKFHPVWLTNGVANNTEARDPQDANIIAAGNCSGAQGEAGIWMCAWTNSIANCQQDEFFITGTQNNNLAQGASSGIKFDFVPPFELPTNFRSDSGDSAVVLSWDGLAGDINGFRVLCEEAATGKPPAGKGFVRPPLNRTPDGRIYYTRENLCPNGPFSTFTSILGEEDDPYNPPATSDTVGDTIGDTIGDTLGTTGDTLGDTTGDTTGGEGETEGLSTGEPGVCGDGIIDADEECDDGEDNGSGQICNEDCTLNVCGDGIIGPDEACDDGENNGDNKACLSDCTLGISDGLAKLDWAYVCSDHIAYNTQTVRISGLENDKLYNFRLVAYDVAGNPRALPDIITAAPIETRDLWGQCKAQGDVCGTSGFCNVSDRGDPWLGLGAVIGLGLGLAGLRRRSQRNRV